jgi:hypothetical protein
MSVAMWVIVAVSLVVSAIVIIAIWHDVNAIDDAINDAIERRRGGD